MASSLGMFSSYEHHHFPQILLGNNSYMSVIRSGSIEVDGGTFNNILCVLRLSTNLISIYQSIHSGIDKKIEFTPDLELIKYLHSRELVAVGNVDHASQLY